MYSKTKTILVILSTGVPAAKAQSAGGTASYPWNLNVPVEVNPSVPNSAQSYQGNAAQFQQAVTSETNDQQGVTSETNSQSYATTDGKIPLWKSAVVGGVIGAAGAGAVHVQGNKLGREKVTKVLDEVVGADGVDKVKLGEWKNLAKDDAKLLAKFKGSRLGNGIVKEVLGNLEVGHLELTKPANIATKSDELIKAANVGGKFGKTLAIGVAATAAGAALIAAGFNYGGKRRRFRQ